MSYITQTIADTNETAITFPSSGVKYKSFILTNTVSVTVTLDLYIKDSTPTTYYLLKNTEIPSGVSLKLEEDEFNFDRLNYTLYINTDNSSGGIDILIRR